MQPPPAIRRLCLGCALILSFAAPACRTPVPPAAPPRALAPPTACADWITCALGDAPLLASLPAPPRRESETLRTVVGECEIIRYRAATAQADYDAGWLARPRGLIAAMAGPDRILREACAGTATRLGGRILTSTSLTVDGHPARDVRITLADRAAATGAQAAARLILLPDRIAHAIVVANSAPLDPCATSWFLDSLRPGVGGDVTACPAPAGNVPAPRTYSAGSTASSR